MRGGASARGYDARWREARAIFLKQHPLCAFCQAEGKIVPATVVDQHHPAPGRSATVLGSDELGSTMQGMP